MGVYGRVEEVHQETIQSNEIENRTDRNLESSCKKKIAWLPFG